MDLDDGGVEVVQSNTPHKKSRMKMGFIDRNGQMIVALPHKMYITIKSHREENEQSFDPYCAMRVYGEVLC